jgi:hypothetical protein
MEILKVKEHNRLRFWIVLITSLSVMLVHLSKALRKQELI